VAVRLATRRARGPTHGDHARDAGCRSIGRATGAVHGRSARERRGRGVCRGGIRNAHLVGYGLGGMVALAYALASSRPASLSVIRTPPAGDDYNPAGVWADPSDPAAVEGSLNGLLSDSFRERHPDVLSRIVEWRLGEDADRETFEAHCAAIEGSTSRTACTSSRRRPSSSTGPRTPCVRNRPRRGSLGLPRGELHAVAGARHFVGWRRPPRSTTLSSAGSRSTPQTRSRSDRDSRPTRHHRSSTPVALPAAATVFAPSRLRSVQ